MKKMWVRVFCALVALSTNMALAQSLPEAKFKYLTFTDPGNYSLSVEAINDWETIVGFDFLGISSLNGPVRGFAYLPFGQKLVTLIDPNDVEGPTTPYGGYTEIYGENNQGTIVGQFWDSATSSYAGFFLNNGVYKTYNAPIPGYGDTAVSSINEEGDFAGWVVQNVAPYATVAFTVVKGKLKLITVPDSLVVQIFRINDFGAVAGYYLDSSGLYYHGFLLEPNGKFTTIDVPGASTSSSGTILLGLNDLGVVSGHFYDSSLNEHGFLRTPNGRFYQVDFPGALETSGGGVNDFGVMVGHYVNQSGTQIGYIGIPY